MAVEGDLLYGLKFLVCARVGVNSSRGKQVLSREQTGMHLELRLEQLLSIKHTGPTGTNTPLPKPAHWA